MDDTEVLTLRDGRWVSAMIPEPRSLIVGVRCGCGQKFWSRKEYRAHYRATHQDAAARSPLTETTDG